MGWFDFLKGKKEEHVAKKGFAVVKQAAVEKVEMKELAKKIMLCGVELDKMPETQEEQLRMMARAEIAIIPHLPTEQDVYWFVIEQYDRILSCGELVASIMATYPLKMYEIEYLDRKSESSYV